MDEDNNNSWWITGKLSVDASTIASSTTTFNNCNSISAKQVLTEDDYDVLHRRLEKIEKRLAILNEPDPTMLETYPALREAYDSYKLIEKLVEGSND